MGSCIAGGEPLFSSRGGDGTCLASHECPRHVCDLNHILRAADHLRLCINPTREPENESQTLGLENVVLQSFRTIAAIVGEPGKAEKFRARLKGWGMDYDERVGFAGRRKDKLGDRIFSLHDARDSAAAHGNRRRREG